MKEDIYISEYLKKTKYGLPVYIQLKEKLKANGYNIHEIKSNNDNEWCRDYMPIKAVDVGKATMAAKS